ncbi:hypothetical protein BC829DRAFT_486842 [Chytridium lagenaria]|nr:hypothetical protein BC829DRAFT_486842 [Chytridium lagenaria]
MAAVESWSSYEVGSWLKSVGLGAYESNFIENDISGDILVHADHGMLKELGVSSRQQRHTSRHRGGEDQIEGMMREITRLNMELMQLRSELSPVWGLVKEYKHFQQKTELRKNASPQIQTSRVPQKSSKSSVKSPSKSATAFSPEVAEFTSPKTPGGSQSFINPLKRSADGNVGTIKIYLDKVLTASGESYKSFRVSVSDSCSKILPAVLKKYKIMENWQNFGLFMQYHRSGLRRLHPRSSNYPPPPSSESLYAIYDYRAQDDQEIDLIIGEKIHILAREPGWVHVIRDAPPITVVNIIPVGYHLSAWEISKTSGQEIAVRKGDVVNLRKRIDHWYAVDFGDQKGWILASFVSLM